MLSFADIDVEGLAGVGAGVEPEVEATGARVSSNIEGVASGKSASITFPENWRDGKGVASCI
jgi:hypothetical protein